MTKSPVCERARICEYSRLSECVNVCRFLAERRVFEPTYVCVQVSNNIQGRVSYVCVCLYKQVSIFFVTKFVS